MLHDESPPSQDEKKPEIPAVAETPGRVPEHPAPPGSADAAPEAAKSGRRKAADHNKDSRESKDHNKIKILKAEIEDLRKEIEAGKKESMSLGEEARAARREAAEWKDKALRALADTDNLRKRLEREKNEFFQFALADTLKDILHVIDNLERAMKAHDAPDGFREGIELIYRQMMDLVAKRGVTPIVCSDGRFDPSFHQALLTEAADGIDEPMIGEELQKGYMLNDRLLRPALVKVLMPRKD